MKKTVTAILALLYLGISSGVALEIHYCMGKKAGIEFYGSGSDQCGKCGMTDKDNGCCHDEFRFYKLNDSHYSSFKDIQPAPGHFIIAPAYYRFQWQLPAGNMPVAVSSHSPPADTGPAACIRNCVFRL